MSLWVSLETFSEECWSLVWCSYEFQYQMSRHLCQDDCSARGKSCGLHWSLKHMKRSKVHHMEKWKPSSNNWCFLSNLEIETQTCAVSETIRKEHDLSHKLFQQTSIWQGCAELCTALWLVHWTPQSSEIKVESRIYRKWMQSTAGQHLFRRVNGMVNQFCGCRRRFYVGTAVRHTTWQAAQFYWFHHTHQSLHLCLCSFQEYVISTALLLRPLNSRIAFVQIFTVVVLSSGLHLSNHVIIFLSLFVLTCFNILWIFCDVFWVLLTQVEQFYTVEHFSLLHVSVQELVRYLAETQRENGDHCSKESHWNDSVFGAIHGDCPARNEICDLCRCRWFGFHSSPSRRLLRSRK